MEQISEELEAAFKELGTNEFKSTYSYYLCTRKAMKH